MHYLLVGNGPAAGLAAAASQADVIVQINDCPHAQTLPRSRTLYVFLVNSGGPDVCPQVVERLIGRRAYLPNASIVLARNPAFYTMKRWLMRARRHRHWGDYRLSKAWTRLRGLCRIHTVSCLYALRLELLLIEGGMPRSFMPSTGMIAYDWLRRRLRPGDSVAIEGFTFQGWHRHPWNVERQLVRQHHETETKKGGRG